MACHQCCCHQPLHLRPGHPFHPAGLAASCTRWALFALRALRADRADGSDGTDGSDGAGVTFRALRAVKFTCISVITYALSSFFSLFGFVSRFSRGRQNLLYHVRRRFCGGDPLRARACCHTIDLAHGDLPHAVRISCKRELSRACIRSGLRRDRHGIIRSKAYLHGFSFWRVESDDNIVIYPFALAHHAQFLHAVAARRTEADRLFGTLRSVSVQCDLVHKQFISPLLEPSFIDLENRRRPCRATPAGRRRL